MNKNKRIIIISSLVLLGIVVTVYLIELNAANTRIGNLIAHEIMKQMTRPHALPSVNTQAWKRLRVGMTKEEVEKLLGEAPSKNRSEPSDRGQKVRSVDYWEYGYTYGFVPIAHPKAFVVYFNPNGKVASFRGPEKACEH